MNDSKSKPARKRAAKKAAAKSETAAKSKVKTGRSEEKAGVGNPTHPVNKHVPDSVLIKRDKVEDTTTKISETGPEVTGDQALQIIDNRNSRPVKVSLIEGVGLTKDTDGRLIFVESNVVHDLMSVEVAKAHFAVKKDGTVLYGQQGFDDVAGGDFDLLDIVKLIEHNNK